MKTALSLLLLALAQSALAASPILTQPVDQTVAEGETATFSVSATGTPVYQWLKNGRWIIGAKSSSYTTPPALLADDNTKFVVNVGSIKSASAYLYVLAGASPTPSATPTATPTVTPSATPTATPLPSIRYAYSCDGNIHDRDDICALPMTLALLSASGQAGALVHLDFNDHFWQTITAQEADETISATANTSNTWGGFDAAVFYNARTSSSAAVAHLAAAINASTSTSPLTIICAGPMQTVGMAIAQSNLSARQWVTVISHSTWNDVHARSFGPSEGLTGTLYNWADLGPLGVTLVHIHDQNGNINGSYTTYGWLNDPASPKLKWLWDRGQVAGKTNFDCSDAGMTYYALFGDDDATPDKVKALLNP